MRKRVYAFSLLMMLIVGAVCLSACASNKVLYFLPEVSCDSQEYTIQHINNVEEDYVLPNGDMLKHNDFLQWGTVSCFWLIKDSEDELVGWIYLPCGSRVDKNGKYQYGLTADKSSGKTYRLNNNSGVLYLLGKDASYLESVEIHLNYGNVEKGIVNDLYDDAEDRNVLGVAGAFGMNFDGIDAKTVDTIKLVISLPVE